MNDENLIPFSERTESERREICSKGGKASGVARSFRSAMKKRIRENPELIEKMLDRLEEEVDAGNLKAFELVIELSGESPKQMEIALKKKELKLREKIADANNW